MLESFKKYIHELTKPKKPRVDGWNNPLTGLGQWGRDKTVSGNFCSPINDWGWFEYDNLYRGDGIAKRIVDVVAAEMLRQGFEIDGDTDGKICKKLEELQFNFVMNDLIKWTRLYGASIIVMGIADGRKLDQPVDESNIYSVDWLRVFDRWQTIIQTVYMNTDLNDPNYGWPEYYEVNDYRTGAVFLVHHSRVLRMDWTILPPRDQMYNQGWGESALKTIYTDLRNYGTAMANTSAIVQDFINAVMTIPGLSQDLVSNCNGTNSMLFKRLDNANLTKGVTNILALDGGETFQKLTSNVSGLPDLIDRFMIAVAGTSGIPVTILFGRSPAGFNATGEQDVRNFYDTIKQYQETKLKPLMEKLVKYIMLSKLGDFKGIELEDWSIQFTPLWQNTEEQEAKIRHLTAETDAIYLDRGVLDATEVAISRFGGDRYSTNTEIDIEKRKGGYSEEEALALEEEKRKIMERQPPDPSIGPDYMGNPQGGDTFIL